jgi:hypothetical protein
MTTVLQRIRGERKRPLFVLVSDFIGEAILQEVYSWKRVLKDAGKTDELDILIHSPGGDLTSCYMVARLFARYTNAWEALVPDEAVSGATLVCLGSCNIVQSEIATLGPLDPQVLSKRREKFFAAERQSPLEAFQAVQYLREFSLASFDAAMTFLLDPRRGVAPQRALEASSQFAAQLVRPILEKVEPYDLGAFALDSSLAISYCQRIATPTDPAKQSQRNVVYRYLVERYPAHEFAIDLAEAKALGFNISEPSQTLDNLFDELRPHLQTIETYVGLISDTTKESES